MRRTIVYGLALVILAGFAGQAGQVGATTQQQESRRERQGRFQWVDPGTWTPREEQLTYEWALERWPVPGGTPKFVAVGQCESGWNRLANNAGRYLGLFQHAATSWAGRVSTYMPRWLRVGPFTRWRNSRTQIFVTARMVNGGGWGPWTCA
jgi:hypothetical protein